MNTGVAVMTRRAGTTTPATCKWQNLTVFSRELAERGSKRVGREHFWTPHPIATRIGTTRAVHEDVNGSHLFYWRYFSRGLPQWRWAEHYGWGRSLLGPLEAPTR